MKNNKLYGLILAISVLILSGCGTDTKENPPVADGPYSFFNATTPLVIKKPVEVNGTVEGNNQEISVQLLKFGLAEAGQAVQMLPFARQYGEVINSIVDTDKNGKAAFEYITPEGSDYNKIKGQDITITAILEDPPSEDVNVAVNEDAPPVIILTQEFVLQFR